MKATMSRYVAHPLMVKAIAYAKVKTDKVDARMFRSSEDGYDTRVVHPR
jgi:hypothetical protein